MPNHHRCRRTAPRARGMGRSSDSNRTKSGVSGTVKILRVALAAGAALGGLGIVLCSSLWGHPVSCSTVTSLGLATRTCQPVGIQVVWPLLAVALLLAIPDISELEIFGVFSLKRQVADQAKRS